MKTISVFQSQFSCLINSRLLIITYSQSSKSINLFERAVLIFLNMKSHPTFYFCVIISKCSKEISSEYLNHFVRVGDGGRKWQNRREPFTDGCQQCTQEQRALLGLSSAPLSTIRFQQRYFRLETSQQLYVQVFLAPTSTPNRSSPLKNITFQQQSQGYVSEASPLSFHVE